jgi:hypothetical protein
MRTFFGMILGALILGIGVYIYDSMSTSSVANGQTAQERRTIVNWDVAANEWEALKTRTKQDWAKLTSQMSGGIFCLIELKLTSSQPRLYAHRRSRERIVLW